jgi:O-antigen/teichoic acid export membrane protein
MVGGIALLAPGILALLFKGGFGPTVPVLRILVWALVFSFLSVPNTRLIFVRDRQAYTSLFLLGSMVTNIVLNVILDGPLGARGAAIARVCSAMVFFLPSYLYVARILIPSNLVRLLYKPGLAALGMAALVALVRSWPLPLSILTGALAYLGLLAVLGAIPTADIALLRQTMADLGSVRSLRRATRREDP